ncbi:hypothetical protein [Pseudoalteromonas sp. SA25]|uniref:zinc ribbon domain-containing protein n=1 Tax=Pseudoalteromonas sp. SA25 TaxID=2686347 RepID=UPI001F0D1B3F|nr:hypothetical protein [Pseudoalteromonas sp. SA25]
MDFRKSIDGLVAIVEGELEGKLYHEIGRFEKSIGICHKCEQHHVLTLSDRNFICIACAKQQNRDLSAKKV